MSEERKIIDLLMAYISAWVDSPSESLDLAMVADGLMTVEEFEKKWKLNDGEATEADGG